MSTSSVIVSGECLVCDRPVAKKGLCGKHYQREWKTGSPYGGGTEKGAVLALVKFMAAARPTDECFETFYGTDANGYPVTTSGGRLYKVSHLVLEATGRPRTEERPLALHSCDNPRCIAPWHLRWGTASDNIRDAYMRGRMPYPAKNHEEWTKA